MYKPDHTRRRKAEENACAGLATEDLEKGEPLAGMLRRISDWCADVRAFDGLPVIALPEHLTASLSAIEDDAHKLLGEWEGDEPPETGERDYCARCGQELEWTGEAWHDRGAGKTCGPYKGSDGEIVAEDYTKPHVATR